MIKFRPFYSITFVIALAPLTTVAALFLCMPTNVHATEPVRQGQESFLIRAVFADHHLWLLSDAGELSAIEESGDSRVTQHLPGSVLDLCVRDGHPVAISNGGDSRWELSVWSNQAWSTITTVPTDGDAFISINCMGGAETILTSKRLIALGKDGAVHSTSLSGPLHRGLVSASYDNGRYFFVALNAGEWGGGLAQIDKITGEVASVEKNITGQLCGGPLNSECDPVNGIAAEPWNNSCLAIAVGLVHMMAHGRIVEVCGDVIRTLYTKPFDSGFLASLSRSHAPPAETIAFFGLTSSGGTLWAVGTDGLYQIDWRGAATMTPLPHFKAIGGIDVSFDNPRVVLVKTSANERHSVSGTVPMLIPR
ncbi:hypothetical protein [Dyella sp. Tek66A03]|uniref:hypothetical protein n=1 Tax=Dyella sp. Tek66A03 TaxID=3458298 RepID=UPI00403E508A